MVSEIYITKTSPSSLSRQTKQQEWNGRFQSQDGSVTLCEIGGQLITASGRLLAYQVRNCCYGRMLYFEEQAKNAYGEILGEVFQPIRYTLEQPRVHESDDLSDFFKGLCIDLKRLAGFNVKFVPRLDYVGCVSWNTDINLLALVHPTSQVGLYDYGIERKPRLVLMGDLLKNVKFLQWRPNARNTLSVACRGGICILTYGGNTACLRPGLDSRSLYTVGFVPSSVQWSLVDFLQSHDDELISALSWSPDGRYLASGSYKSSSLTIWDVDQGVSKRLCGGLAGTSLLKWSPCGNYLFAAKRDATFHLWETRGWRSKSWSSKFGGFVTGAEWAPDGRMILIAFSESLKLRSIHLVKEFPSLDAHMLHVELPELEFLTNSVGIEKMAWAASKQRLAVSFKDGNELYKGLIALYDVTSGAPGQLFKASLIGFIRGPGDGLNFFPLWPLTFSFHDKYIHGPLLSVCWSNGICVTYPLVTQVPA